MRELSVLIDIDGVIRIGKKPAEGVNEFFNFLAEKKIPAALISNSTLSNAEDINEFFKENKIECPFAIMTAADATLNYVRTKYSNASVYCIEKIKTMFNEFLTDENPEAVVLGDLDDKWDYQILNEIFNKVLNGADLIAMQKNRYWKTPERGYILDAGPFVAAIEYAVQKEAVLIGKPSELYFNSALEIIGAAPNGKFIMIGDDLETDIAGAKKLGAETILMSTGKTKFPLDEKSKNIPDYTADSLTEVVEIINSLLKEQNENAQ